MPRVRLRDLIIGASLIVLAGAIWLVLQLQRSSSGATFVEPTSNTLLAVVLTLMLIFYAGQAIIAALLAMSQELEDQSLWHYVMTFPRFIKTWASALTILLLPLGLSLVPELPKIHLFNDELAFAKALYTANVSMLAILITIEVGLFVSIHKYNLPYWRELLPTALSLDIVTMYIFTVFIQAPSQEWTTGDVAVSTAFMLYTLVLAFVSSFLVILFVRAVGLQDSNVVAKDPTEVEGSLEASGETN